MDTCDRSTPEAAAPPYEPPHPDLLRQDWPVDPAARERIVAYLASLTEPGAVEPRRHRDGRPRLDAQGDPVMRKVTPRLALRAMRSLGTLGGQALEQERLDRLAQREQGRAFCLNDHVTEAVNLGGQMLTAEAHRRGLSCAAEVDAETRRAIGEAAEAQLAAEAAAAGLAQPPEPAPAVRLADPARRRDWVIPAAVQARIMARLIDMIDPLGEESAVLSVREKLMAVGVLGVFERLALGQQELDRVVRGFGEVFDEERALAEMDAATEQRLAERKLEDEQAADEQAAEVLAC